MGDLLLVSQNEPFPADLIALASSYDNGVCFIETGALDGEKNLKPKNSLEETYKLFRNEKEHDTGLKLNVTAEPPSQQLY